MDWDLLDDDDKDEIVILTKKAINRARKTKYKMVEMCGHHIRFFNVDQLARLQVMFEESRDSRFDTAAACTKVLWQIKELRDYNSFTTREQNSFTTSTESCTVHLRGE